MHGFIGGHIIKCCLVLLENVGAIGRLIMHGFMGGTLLNWIGGLDH